MIIKLFFIIIFNFIFAINVAESDTTKKIINHDWKLNVFFKKSMDSHWTI